MQSVDYAGIKVSFSGKMREHELQIRKDIFERGMSSMEPLAMKARERAIATIRISENRNSIAYLSICADRKELFAGIYQYNKETKTGKMYRNIDEKTLQAVTSKKGLFATLEGKMENIVKAQEKGAKVFLGRGLSEAWEREVVKVRKEREADMAPYDRKRMVPVDSLSFHPSAAKDVKSEETGKTNKPASITQMIMQGRIDAGLRMAGERAREASVPLVGKTRQEAISIR